jgi:hypothetical protein
MPYITTVVYLNDGDHHFDGFNKYAPAKLREAARFDLEVLDDVPSQHAIPGALEIVFEQLNIPSPYHPWAIAYAASRSVTSWCSRRPPGHAPSPAGHPSAPTTCTPYWPITNSPRPAGRTSNPPASLRSPQYPPKGISDGPVLHPNLVKQHRNYRARA